MKRAFPLALVVACALPAARPCAASTFTTSRSYASGSIQTVAVEFPAGDLQIRSSDDDQITVRMVARCRSGGARCEERVQEIRLVSNTTGRTLELKLEGLKNNAFPRGPQIDLEIAVPADRAVRVEMGAGDLTVHGLTGDVRVAMGAGDVNLRLEERSVGEVAVNVGVGDATLRRHREPVGGRGFISKRLRWEGDGSARVDVDLGVGDVSVALD